MYSLILHGRRSCIELQKWRHLSVPLQNTFAFFSSSAIADLSLENRQKEKTFSVSYLIDSLSLSTKLAESIWKKVVSSEGKGNNNNPDLVLSLLRSHGFTDSHISSIVKIYPQLLRLDAEKSISPKLEFLQSREASLTSVEFTEIVSKVPKILATRGGKTISIYYDFVKEIVQADKSSKFRNVSRSLGQGSWQENKMRNVLVLRDLGVPQRLLFALLFDSSSSVCGKDKFEESLDKVVEMGFDPTTSRFVQALNVVCRSSRKRIEERVNVCINLGFEEGDVWEMFKKYPRLLTFSEKKILNSFETFLGVGFTREEFVMIVKSLPQCLGYCGEPVKEKVEFVVKKMNWPLKALVSNPAVFGLSLEKRTVPRCNVINALRSKGLLGDKLPSISVLRFTDEIFLERYVRRHDNKELVAELMAIFSGARVS